MNDILIVYPYFSVFHFRVMKLLQMSQVGRYYYDPTRPCPIPQHRLELWPGYITSIQAYEGWFVVKVNSS